MKILFQIVLIFCISPICAQNKKEQIKQLTFTLDSLKTAMDSTRREWDYNITELNKVINRQKIEVEHLYSSLNFLNQQLDQKIVHLDQKQKELDSLRSEIELVKKEAERLKTLSNPKYLITNNSVGLFKLSGAWQNSARNKYFYKFIQGYGDCIDACCDGGYDLGNRIISQDNYQIIETPDLTIGCLIFSRNESENTYKKNASVFYIKSANCSGWYWKDIINYIVVYSEAFKTKEGIGVGTTLETVRELFGEFVINIGWVEEDANAIGFSLNSYPDISFVLDGEDLKGGYDQISTLGETVKLSDFKYNTKIKRVIVNSQTNDD